MLPNTRFVPAFRTLLLVGGILSVFIITFFSYPAISSIKSSQWLNGCPSVVHDTTKPSSDLRLPPVKRHNVVVSSEFGYHVDVYMALVWTLERVTNKPVPVYAGQPFHHGFSDLAKNINLHRGPFYDPAQLHPDLEKDNAIDMVVLGTCEIEYVASVNNSDAEQLSVVVCVMSLGLRVYSPSGTLAMMRTSSCLYASCTT